MGRRRLSNTFAAKVMRMILIDHAREAKRRCGAADWTRPLSDDLVWVNIDSPEC